ncbi:MAG: hypothetical protein ACRC1D_08915 [Culicoidibacterales bacterium]
MKIKQTQAFQLPYAKIGFFPLARKPHYFDVQAGRYLYAEVANEQSTLIFLVSETVFKQMTFEATEQGLIIWKNANNIMSNYCLKKIVIDTDLISMPHLDHVVLKKKNHLAQKVCLIPKLVSNAKGQEKIAKSQFFTAECKEIDADELLLYTTNSFILTTLDEKIVGLAFEAAQNQNETVFDSLIETIQGYVHD